MYLNINVKSFHINYRLDCLLYNFYCFISVDQLENKEESEKKKPIIPQIGIMSTKWLIYSWYVLLFSSVLAGQGEQMLFTQTYCACLPSQAAPHGHRIVLEANAVKRRLGFITATRLITWIVVTTIDSFMIDAGKLTSCLMRVTLTAEWGKRSCRYFKPTLPVTH